MEAVQNDLDAGFDTIATTAASIRMIVKIHHSSRLGSCIRVSKNRLVCEDLARDGLTNLLPCKPISGELATLETYILSESNHTTLHKQSLGVFHLCHTSTCINPTNSLWEELASDYRSSHWLLQPTHSPFVAMWFPLCASPYPYQMVNSNNFIPIP